MKKLPLIILSVCLLSILSLSAKVKYYMDFDKDTKSLVRKMLVFKNPAWVAKAVTEESKEFYFVSPKSMFEFHFNPEKWPAANIKSQKDIKNLVVTDYATLRAIDAKKAYYVYGSNKISPAGDDLPAFKDYEQAKIYADKHHGRRIFEFSKVSKGLIELLNGDI